MKKEFVRTENALRLEAAVHTRERRGATESGMVIVHGRAGEGKTKTLLHWAAARQAVMMTAYPGWTPRRAMVDLAFGVGVPTKGDWEGAVAKAIAAAETPIVVDEAGFALVDNAATIERLRTITDKAGTLLLLVVMERDMARLRQFDQITSRAVLCPFQANTAADVALACAQLGEVEIAEDLVQRIARESGTRMRLVLDAIALVENWARSQDKRRVSAADVAEAPLCQDFNSTASARPRASVVKLPKATRS